MSNLLKNFLDPHFIPPERMENYSGRRRQTLEEFKAAHPIDALATLRRHAEFAAQQSATVQPMRRQHVKRSYGGRERVAA